MSNVYCIPESYLWLLMIISFGIGYIVPMAARMLRDKYGWIKQD